MPFRSKGYDTERVAFLQECLTIATEVASRVRGEPASHEVIQRLAAAITEGADSDIGTRDELVDFALASLPEFRSALAN